MVRLGVTYGFEGNTVQSIQQGSPVPHWQEWPPCPCRAQVLAGSTPGKCGLWADTAVDWNVQPLETVAISLQEVLSGRESWWHVLWLPHIVNSKNRSNTHSEPAGAGHCRWDSACSWNPCTAGTLALLSSPFS